MASIKFFRNETQLAPITAEPVFWVTSKERRAPGKLKYLAGSESGQGAFITDTNPEDVAEPLRSVVVE